MSAPRKKYLAEIDNTCAAIKKEFPDVDVNALLTLCMENAASIIERSFAAEGLDSSSFSEDEKSSLLSESVLQLLLREQKTLRQAKSAALVSPVVQRQYSDEEKQAVKEKLASLTGLSNWVTCDFKDRLQLFHEMDSVEQVAALVKILKNTKAMKADQRLTTTTPKKPVIVVFHVNPERLAEVEKLEGWAEPTVVPVAEATM